MKSWLCALLFTALLCQGSPSDARKAIKEMQAKDYFRSELEVRFANAIAQGHSSKMQQALAAGADVNGLGREEMRPLYWALCKQSLNGFKFLLEHGADANVRGKAISPGQPSPSVMGAAAILKNPEYLRLALQHGGKPDFDAGYGGRSIIYEAILHSRIENVRLLSQAKADVNH